MLRENRDGLALLRGSLGATVLGYGLSAGKLALRLDNGVRVGLHLAADSGVVDALADTLGPDGRFVGGTISGVDGVTLVIEGSARSVALTVRA